MMCKPYTLEGPDMLVSFQTRGVFISVADLQHLIMTTAQNMETEADRARVFALYDMMERLRRNAYDSIYLQETTPQNMTEFYYLESTQLLVELSHDYVRTLDTKTGEKLYSKNIKIIKNWRDLVSEKNKISHAQARFYTSSTPSIISPN